MASQSNINCPSCSKQIIPRLIIERGEVTKQLCPFCLTRLNETMWDVILDNLKFLNEQVPTKLKFALIGLAIVLFVLS